MPLSIAILKTTQDVCKLESINKVLNLPILSKPAKPYTHYLCIEEGKLQICFADHPTPLQIDFLDKANVSKHLNLKHQPLPSLFQALGFKKNHSLTVLDATAGFASDSFMLAFMGVEVIACERNPFIYHLLADALERAAQGPPSIAATANRITLYHANAIDILNEHEADAINAIYYDPMFTDHGNKALNQLPMRQLRNLVGDDDDAENFIDHLRQTYSGKLVVKRSAHAPVGPRAAHHSITGKAIRYDVYQ